MKLPEKYKEIILTEPDPGQIYRRCLAEMAKDKIESDYFLTETIVYATEFLYALQVLQSGKPSHWWNFADFRGDADQKLWAILTPILNLNVAFVGSGPYPVTAFQMREQYPQAQITCIDNHVAAYFIGKAVSEKSGMNVSFLFSEAMEVDYQPFNAVIVAAMVSGKSRLVKKILSSSKAVVIVRGKVDVFSDRVIQCSSTFEENGAFSFSSPENPCDG